MHTTEGRNYCYITTSALGGLYESNRCDERYHQNRSRHSGPPCRSRQIRRQLTSMPTLRPLRLPPTTTSTSRTVPIPTWQWLRRSRRRSSSSDLRPGLSGLLRLRRRLGLVGYRLRLGLRLRWAADATTDRAVLGLFGTPVCAAGGFEPVGGDGLGDFERDDLFYLTASEYGCRAILDNTARWHALNENCIREMRGLTIPFRPW